MKHSFLFVSLALLTLAAATPSTELQANKAPLTNSRKGLIQTPLIDISNYKSWKKINKEPHLTNGILIMSCIARPIPDDPHTPARQGSGIPVIFKSELGEKELYKYAYINIYVNPIGESSMLKHAKPKFPVGSIIVKERHSSSKSKTADYITVMRKLPAETKPETGDWQYLVYAQDAKTELKKHNLPDCMSCHAQWKDTDYTSREYLTQEQLAALK